jgi:hypothetical protein
MIDDEKLAELKTKYGMIRVCETAAGTIVLRKPTGAEWNKFQTMAQSEDLNQNNAAQRTFICDIAAYPERTAMVAAFNDWVALDKDRGLQKAMRELTGQVASEEGKG